jgi:hypothetical protein
MSESKANRTQQDLEMAILRIERNRPRVIEKNRKLSILAVAEEAGISGASIHNNYPEIAEKIRVKINKDTRAQRDEKNSALKIEKGKNKMLRIQVANLTNQLRDMASENAKIFTENQHLNAIVNSGNVHVINSNKT